MDYIQSHLWPPQYKLARHPRAKRVKLRISSCGLEITVPVRFNLRRIPEILEGNKAWIMEKLKHLPREDNLFLPESLSLPAFAQQWSISYMSAPTQLQIIERPSHEIVLLGELMEKKNCIAALLAWIKSYFRPQLIAKLDSIVKETQLFYRIVSIRDQKTMWGSCTANGAISLNYKLCFLPEPLVRYVMIHELCHTKHLNHSKHFWQLVSCYDPLWQEHRYQLRKSDTLIPSWVSV